MKDYFGLGDRSFRRMLFRLALPVMLQQLVAASISLIDNIMIGSLGDTALAALLQANQATFLLLVFMFGISSAAQAFTSQYWGQHDIASIRSTQGFAVLCGQVVGWAFCLLALLMPAKIVGIFTNDAAVLDLGTQYLRIVCLSYPVIAFTQVYASILRGTEHVKLPMMTSIIGLVCNGFLNYVLIFGALGFPAMGVRGAAIATVIAHITDACLLAILSKVLKKPTAASEYPMFRFSREFVRRFIAVSVPVFLNESLWSLAQATVVLVYSRLGTQMAAAMGVFSTFERLGFVAYIGMGNACAVICGKSIGAEEESKAQLYARRIVRSSPLFGLAAALAVNALMPFALLLYNISELARSIVINNVLVYLVLSPVMAVNHAIVVGILRSGGDVRYSLWLDAGLQWALIVTGVAVAAFVLCVPLQWVYAFMLPGEIVKMLLGRRRVVSGQWIHRLIA